MDFDQYGQLLITVNKQDVASSSWLFVDGMGFADEAVWWPSLWQKRPNPHEGLDLVRFSLGSKEKDVFPGFLVISPVSGVVVDICTDFLDKTVWINPENQPDHLVLLSHMQPFVFPGQNVICGDPVGIISFTDRDIPLHLHLSVLRGQWQLIKKLSWQEIHQQRHARFIYPVF